MRWIPVALFSVGLLFIAIFVVWTGSILIATKGTATDLLITQLPYQVFLVTIPLMLFGIPKRIRDDLDILLDHAAGYVFSDSSRKD